MKYYKVVDQITVPVTIDTKKNNYGTTLKNQGIHEKLIEIVTASSKKLDIPLDVYFTLNNHIASGGNDYLAQFPLPVSGYYDVSNLTSHLNANLYKIPENEFRKFIADIDANNIYIFLEGHYLWEYLYEEARLSTNNTLPSRKESLFLFENIADSKYYIDTHKGFGTICEVELIDTVNLFRGDMNLLDEIPNYLTFHQTINWANRYWKKESSSKPVYEILFQGTCRLVPQAEVTDFLMDFK